MRFILVLAVAAAVATPTAARELIINLSATVTTRCVVTDIRAIETDQGLVQIRASCNSTAFQVILGGDLAALPIRSASASHASVSVRGNTLAVRPERPGAFLFDVHYGASLDDVRSASADIQTL